MTKNINMKKDSPVQAGVTINENGIHFMLEISTQEECGILLYPKKRKEAPIRIPFTRKHKNGNLYCGYMEGLVPEEYDYNFYIGGEEVVDSYARVVYGNEIWGSRTTGKMMHSEPLRSGFLTEDYDWGGDKPLYTPYEESIFYGLHVRGFTKHSSSKVKHKGTFAGVAEKIPYLKELGITAIELLPICEFEEIERKKPEVSMEYAVEHYKEDYEKVPDGMNYWGYKKGFYFAPKASYSVKGNAVRECKDMIRELHASGIEVIMQFYFPRDIRPGYILEVLKYWVSEYHIDGIRLIGDNMPITLLATEPLLKNTKLLYYGFPLAQIYKQGEVPEYLNLAVCQDDFMHCMRKFLKSDSGVLPTFLEETVKTFGQTGRICYITDYQGFTLTDLVSYDKKHNMANGEENQDGTDYNNSWNCGAEGPSRKQAMISLRKKQIKNAFLFVLLAQGTPFFMAGDEFGNSQRGNNNPYCQDNEITWLNWNQTASNGELLAYVRELIAFRRQHSIFGNSQGFTFTDILSSGFPDVSFHGEEAWRPVLQYNRYHAGILYYEKYAPQGESDDFYYIAYNMHWETHSFSFPKLPKGKKWELIMDTKTGFLEKPLAVTMPVTVPARTVQIYRGK